MRGTAAILMKLLHKVLLCAIASVPPMTSARAVEPDIVIADFEGKDFGAWKSEGDAFGPGPAAGAFPLSTMPKPPNKQTAASANPILWRFACFTAGDPSSD